MATSIRVHFKSRILLLSLAGVVAALGDTIQTSAVIAGGYFNGGLLYGRPDSGSEVDFYVPGSNNIAYYLQAPQAALLSESPTCASSLCDPSFATQASFSMQILENPTTAWNSFPPGYIYAPPGGYNSTVTLNLSFISADQVPLTRYLANCQSYFQGVCQSWTYGYQGAGPVTYVVSGMESWTRPDGATVQVNILPSDLAGQWFYDSYQNSIEISNGHFFTPEPSSGALTGLSLIVVLTLIACIQKGAIKEGRVFRNKITLSGF